MGSVWAARDGDAAGPRVALKTVLATKRSSQKLASLFVEEARISRAIRHPNLLEMVDAGEDDGVPFLAMEWVEGITLRRLSERPDRVPLPLLLRVCMEACDGLHAAHEARTDDGTPLEIVHRDVSPHNLLVSELGRVKVIDFGIAKANARLVEETTDGVLRGKVRYMAPEHALGHRLDRRADIWSLGVTLLETSTGRIPYSGEHDIAALVKLVSCEPELPEEGSLPPAVWALVRRALRKNKLERFTSAREMGTELESILVAMGARNTRRDLAHLVREELRAGSEPAPRMASASDLSTARMSPPRLLLQAQAAAVREVVTARVPQAVIDALVDSELREQQSVAEEVIPALFVTTSTAVILPASERESSADESGERESADASGPVPRPGRRRRGFILASGLMILVLVAVVAIRGRAFNLTVAASESSSAAASPADAFAPPPAEIVSVAPYRLPPPEPNEAVAKEGERALPPAGLQNSRVQPSPLVEPVPLAPLVPPAASLRPGQWKRAPQLPRERPGPPPKSH